MLKIHLRDDRRWFRYDSDWPNFAAVRQAIRQGSDVELGYANCRPPAGIATECDAFDIVVDGARRLTSAAAVSTERDQSAHRLRALAVIGVVAGILASLLGLYCVANSRRDEAY